MCKKAIRRLKRVGWFCTIGILSTVIFLWCILPLDKMSFLIAVLVETAFALWAILWIGSSMKKTIKSIKKYKP